MSPEDFINLAKLTYSSVAEIKRIIRDEGTGSIHPNYDNFNANCCLCDEPLTAEDNDGPELDINGEEE